MTTPSLRLTCAKCSIRWPQTCHPTATRSIDRPAHSCANAITTIIPAQAAATQVISSIPYRYCCCTLSSVSMTGKFKMRGYLASTSRPITHSAVVTRVMIASVAGPVRVTLPVKSNAWNLAVVPADRDKEVDGQADSNQPTTLQSPKERTEPNL